jgi:hypothetical protein
VLLASRQLTSLVTDLKEIKPSAVLTESAKHLTAKASFSTGASLQFALPGIGIALLMFVAIRWRRERACKYKYARVDGSL